MFVFSILVLLGPSTSKAGYSPDAGAVDYKSVHINWHDADRDRDVPVKIYYPAGEIGTASKSRLPVIIFSHGLGGSREGYSYLGQHWASHGFVVVHLTHIGSDTRAIFAGGVADLKKTEQKIVSTPMVAVDRCRDVSFAIDQITAADTDDSSPLKGRLDLKHIGMAGHSFGGNTTMLISGEQTRSGRSFADDRITAAIAMSPPVATPQPRWDAVYGGVKIPLFVMTGTLDDSPIGATTADQRRVPFDHVRKIPAYLITFEGADHMTFSGRREAADKPADERFHQLILQGSTAFWDAYLHGDESAKKWLKTDYEKVVGGDGLFEQK